MILSCSSYVWKENVLEGPGRSEILSLSVHASDALEYSYAIEPVEKGLYRVDWTFRAAADIPDAHISVDVDIPSESRWWMLPSISYNGNQWGTGREPKTASDGENGWWTYSYRRSPIPGAAYSENDEYAVACWYGVPQSAEDDFSYSIMPEKTRTALRYIWPEEEMPRTYCSRDRYADGWRKAVSMKKGQTHRVEMYLRVDPVEDGHRAISHFLADAWHLSEKPSFEIPDKESLWKYAVQFAKESLWDPSEECIGFRTGLGPDYPGRRGDDYGDSVPVESGWERSWHKMQGYHTGWVGRNINLAGAMLGDYLKTGNPESFRMGLSTLDHFAEHGPLPSGLFPSALPRGGYDACHMGTASMAFRDAYRLAKACGVDRPQYLKIALDICDVVMATQREDGCYGRYWDPETATPGSYDGYTATYMIQAMTEAYRQTSDRRYLDSAAKAFDYYMKEFDRYGFTTAGALDTDCIDKESSIPIFMAAVHLYDILKDGRYLDDAVTLGYYMSTWLWHYDGVYPADDSFTRHGYHTFGGTAVSTQHQCLDNFGIMPVHELKMLADQTGDEQWREKADAMYNYSSQLISDGTLEINGRIRPAGAQSEAYFQAEWALYGNVSRFDNWLVDWPDAFRLELLIREGFLEKTAAQRFFPGETVPEECLGNYKDFFRVQPVPDDIFALMQGKTYKEGCTIPRDELRYILCLHKDAQGRSIVGEMVAGKTAAEAIKDILLRLYEASYPIERMRLPDYWDADDEKQMRDNNSSCFNYRTVSGSAKLSSHSLGIAVDINPLYNPYVKARQDGTLFIQPETAVPYADRDAEFDYKTVPGDLCCTLFRENGFEWGGDWKSLKDYQHFELPH